MPAIVNVSVTQNGDGFDLSVSPWQVEVGTNAPGGHLDIEWNCTFNGTHIDPVKIVFFRNHFAKDDPQGSSPLNSGNVKTTGPNAPPIGNIYRYRIRLFHGKGRPFVIDPEYVRK